MPRTMALEGRSTRGPLDGGATAVTSGGGALFSAGAAGEAREDILNKLQYQILDRNCVLCILNHLWIKKVSHLCDFEPACSSQLQCVVAQADGGAEAGTAVGSEAGIEVGTEACTEAEAEAEAVAGSEAAAWPLRGTGWRRPRRRWRSPGLCGWSKSLGSAGWDGPEAEERPLMTACAPATSHHQNLTRSLSERKPSFNYPALDPPTGRCVGLSFLLSYLVVCGFQWEIAHMWSVA